MKHLFQDVSSGETLVSEVPVPRCKPGHLLIRTTCSLISAGTERSLVEFGKAGYLEKARQQPDKVKMVLDKARTDGLMTTVEAVRSKLAEPMPMGYSNVGVVVEVGRGVEDFQVGDRVLSNGNHAEFVCVPRNLCAQIPDRVDDESASFGVLGAIALQGIRLAEPSLGETFAVTGLGLIGLLAVQILRANGCRVIGIDLDASKLDMAEAYGAQVVRLDRGQDAVAEAERITGGVGADGVIITASAKTDEVIHQAATMCRKRGRIILVGVVGLNLRRSDFYEKELTFQVSCSYGPGRYDPSYEDQGHDYPLPFVRWTENRNIQAVLGLMESEQLRVSELVSARHPILEAGKAYDLLLEDRGTLGVILEYPREKTGEESRTVQLAPAPPTPVGKGVLGAIGAGNYASRVLLPAFKDAGARLKVIASSQGKSGTHVGNRLGFEVNTTDMDVVLQDPEVDLVVIATRHDSHARMTVAALEAGKHIFVEKPLAMTLEDLERVAEARTAALEAGKGGCVMVGFNRRFAPLMVKLKSEVDRSGAPLALVYTCNAGAVPADSWVHDPEAGGGRIVGEACHFIDIARFLAGSPMESWSVEVMDDPQGLGDTATLALRFANGSIAVVHYFANGNRAFPKERIEVFQGGRILTLNNFRSVKGFGTGTSLKGRSWKQDKGQNACAVAFLEAVRGGGEDPIPFEELLEVSRVTVELADAARGR